MANVDPNAEARRLAAQRAHAAGDPSSPEWMTKVVAIAGFEMVDLFAEWARRGQALSVGDVRKVNGRDLCGGLGPPWFMKSETPEQFGERAARAILRLLIEV